MLLVMEEESHAQFTLEDVALALGVTRKTLSALLNGRQSVSPVMALRLSIVFPGPTAEFWLRLQDQFDLAKARQTFNGAGIQPFVPMSHPARAA